MSFSNWGDYDHYVIFWGDFDHYVSFELKGLWSRGFWYTLPKKNVFIIEGLYLRQKSFNQKVCLYAQELEV